MPHRKILRPAGLALITDPGDTASVGCGQLTFVLIFKQTALYLERRRKKTILNGPGLLVHDDV